LPLEDVLRLADALFALYCVLWPLRLYVGRPIRLHFLLRLLPFARRSVQWFGASGKGS
jgi:hypothetical protein